MKNKKVSRLPKQINHLLVETGQTEPKLPTLEDAEQLSCEDELEQLKSKELIEKGIQQSKKIKESTITQNFTIGKRGRPRKHHDGSEQPVLKKQKVESIQGNNEQALIEQKA